MRRKQILGAVGAGCGILALLVWLRVAPWLLGALVPFHDDPVSRLVFVFHWLAGPGAMLLIGVWVAARRGFLPDAIDGTRSPTSHALEINLRYNQNTLEQLLLAVIAWCALAIDLPPDRLYLIPAMAVSFIVGRATFWIGYLLHPMGRAFGMVVTIVPTISAYLWLGWRAVTS